MPKILNDILTGKDNETFESNRCYFFYTQVLISIVIGYSLYFHHSFDILMLAQTEGILAIAFPLGVKIKDTTEPPAPIIPPVFKGKGHE